MSALDLHDETVVGRTLVLGGDSQLADKIHHSTLERCVLDFRRSGWRGSHAPAHAAQLREVAALPENTESSRIALEIVAGEGEDEVLGRSLRAVTLDAELQKEPWPDTVWRSLLALPFVRGHGR